VRIKRIPLLWEKKMIKFLKNFGVYFLELAFLFLLFGFAWFLLVAFG